MNVSPLPSRRQRDAGFTLIELMIVVAVIGILSAIAYPSYTDYIRRGRLPEAFTTLADLRARMEQYYQDNKNYGASGGSDCATDASANGWNKFPSGDYFDFACQTKTAAGDTTGQSFTLTATGKAGTVTAGHVYTINQDGVRATTFYKGAAVTASCWLTKSTSC